MMRPFVLAAAFASAAMTSYAAGDLSQVKRGQQLLETHGCHDCHTPLKMGPKGPEPDLSRLLSGHPEQLVMGTPPKLEGAWMYVGSGTNTAFAGPWGTSYAINLTPDEQTGIGKWREQDFVQAIKTGKHLGVGRPIMPPMPWQAYSNLKESDLKAIFAYLRSVPAQRNHVPEYAPPPVKSAAVTAPR